MKKIFKSFLTYSLLPDHQKTCRGCKCKFPHSGAKLNVKAMFLCTGAALESLKWSRFYSCSAAISSCTQSWTAEILEFSIRPLHIHGTEKYLRFKWTCRLWALLLVLSLYSHTDVCWHQSLSFGLESLLCFPACSSCPTTLFVVLFHLKCSPTSSPKFRCHLGIDVIPFNMEPRPCVCVLVQKLCQNSSH